MYHDVLLYILGVENKKSIYFYLTFLMDFYSIQDSSVNYSEAILGYCLQRHENFVCQ